MLTSCSSLPSKKMQRALSEQEQCLCTPRVLAVSAHPLPASHLVSASCWRGLKGIFLLCYHAQIRNAPLPPRCIWCYLLLLLGQFCVLYLPIKRGKAAEETLGFSTHRGKHHVLAAGACTGKPQPNKQVRKMDPSQGHRAQYVCSSLDYFDAPVLCASASEPWWCTGYFKRVLHKINSKVPGKITVHQVYGFFSLPFLDCLPCREGFSLQKGFWKDNFKIV